ncbi:MULTISPECIES: type II toxin-antitoxin system RnlB family antitoxin [Achromobacter]|uniref:type II toxin-antitoxin system RnlB family antitoxin n=1 Tax=Achromobacter marplatensis TaxID=470868 RepID=UPI0035E3D224
MTAPKGYSLQKGPSDTFPIISFSLSSERPEVFLPKVERELKRKGYRGRVLVDTLACNGVSSRRFFVAVFDGETLSRSSIKILPASKLDAVTERFCSLFYAKHSTSLENSVLTKAQQYLLRSSEKNLRPA